MKIASARKNLQKEIVDLSVSIAEKVIKKNVCQDKNEILVDELVVSLSQVKN